MKKKRKSFLGSVLKFIIALIIIFILVIFCMSIYANISSQKLIRADGTHEIVHGKKEYITALVCGVNAGLSDTIMYIKYDVSGGKLAIMSIPRDTYVNDGEKINSLYNKKNIAPLVNQVQEIVNENIDYYVVVDTKILREIVDEIGGVEVDVPFDMKYDDPTQDLHIDIKEGKQVLNGAQAEGYVRFRHNNDFSIAYAMGDLGRIKTQQEFVKTFISQLFKFKNIIKAKNIIDIILNNTITNISSTDVFKYMFDVMSIDTEKIVTMTASGEAKYIDGISYFLIDKKDTLLKLQEAFI